MTKQLQQTLCALCLLVALAACAPDVPLAGAHTAGDAEPLTIGAILPLTGGAAVWGEDMRHGMELAQQELAEQGTIVNFVFEDSKAKPTHAVNAFNKLVNVDDVDVVFSAFSRVSAPLVPLADQAKLPLLMTVVSAPSLADKSPFAFRFYSNEKQYIEPHFEQMDLSVHDRLAILYLNDEFGVGVRDAIRHEAEQEGIDIVAAEAFSPGSTDYRTSLIKIKAKNPDVLAFVTGFPIESVSILEQLEELGMDAEIIEASAVLSSAAVREKLGSKAEGVSTIAHPFTLGSGAEFKQEFVEQYNTDPMFAAAFAYDMVLLVARVGDGSTDSVTLTKNILEAGSFESLNGPVVVQPNGEINPRTISARIVDGKLVPN